jgi:hypothetical protein
MVSPKRRLGSGITIFYGDHEEDLLLGIRAAQRRKMRQKTRHDSPGGFLVHYATLLTGAT